MKVSNYFVFSLKNINSNIKLISNKFLIKSGFINQVSNGIYIYLPICFELIKNLIYIIKLELKKINFIELLLPSIQPSKFLKISKRFLKFKSELFFLKKKFILSPTNEEIITYLLKNKLKYYNTPLNFYQISNKFRNEIRSNSGLIRCKEFLMKDGYSFNLDIFSLKKNYEDVYNIYILIFNKLGINFNTLISKDILMGGNYSHEFYANSDFVNYNNLFKLSYILSFIKNLLINYKNTNFIFFKIFIINISDFFLFSNYLRININIFYKLNILIYNSLNNKIIFNLLFYNSMLCGKIKLNKINIFFFRLINFIELNKNFNINYNYSGFNKKINIKIIVDKSIFNLNNFFLSFNKKNYILNIFNKTVKYHINKNFIKKRKIEIGHIFQIGDFYSKKFNLKIKNKNNKFIYLLMNSFGVGITRVISSIISQNYDNYGMS